MKIHTIWKYGVAFFENSYQAEGLRCDNIIYEGHTDAMPDSIAEEVAEIHPNFQKYSEYAMAALYKTYDKKGGSESPQYAIESLKTKSESSIDKPYIVIWWIPEDTKDCNLLK